MHCVGATDGSTMRDIAQYSNITISSALALRHQFTVCRDVLEQVEIFKYLGQMSAQYDDDIQAVRAQLRKAHAVWAQVGPVLCSQNVAHLLRPRGSTRP
jgi:hypothetical protein